MELFEIYQSTKNPSTGSASRNHQPTRGPPLEFINQLGGPPLEFINMQPKNGGPPLEFINQLGGPPLELINQLGGSASRSHQPTRGPPL